MELNLTAAYEQAVSLQEATTHALLGDERMRGAKQFKEGTLRETSAFLRDFAQLAESKDFSERELAKMLANTCVETASFLFSAGAPADLWRQWCFAASLALFVARDFAYCMQLAAISRSILQADMSSGLQNCKLESYREQAVQFVIFRKWGAQLPTLPPNDPLDAYYQILLNSLHSGAQDQLSSVIARIVQFWLSETSYGKFEPGVYPAFEPEICAVVSAFLAQGIKLQFKSSKCRRFLQAALE